MSQYDHLTRQLDLIPVETLGLNINVIGCGAIGSFTSLALAKMGLLQQRLWDHDTVSIENMSNQFFRRVDIDKNKAEALSNLVRAFTGEAVASVNPSKFEAQHAAGLTGVVIAAVDSMEARRMILEAVLDQPNAVKYIIDPRMGAEQYTQYTINPRSEADVAMYRKSLYTDNEAVQERCTAKSTIYTATIASGMITKTIKNILLGEAYPRTVNWNIKVSDNNPNALSMVMYSGNV